MFFLNLITGGGSVSIPILLTATIRPHFSIGNLMQDWSIREAQYYDALLHVIMSSRAGQIIIFAENSGSITERFHDLLALAKQYGAILELLDLSAPQSVSRGKGWCEGDLMRKAVNSSEFLKGSIGFVKLTGRLKIPNQKGFIDSVESMVDRKPVNFIAQTKIVDRQMATQFFYVSSFFYNKYLVDAHYKVDDLSGVYLEHVYGEIITAKILSGEGFFRFYFPVPVCGINGFSGKITNGSINISLKVFLNEISCHLICKLG
jgi:hypothetical protein